MPSPVALSQFVPQIFRLPRFLVGRFHRRRHRHQVRRSVRRRRPEGRWWSPDERWFGGSFPPRRHNALLPLVDGRDTFAALLDAVRHAEEYVYIAGWALTPAFALDQARGDHATDDLLTEVLAAVAPRVTVKVLVWSGSPLLFQPTRRVTSRARDALLQAAPQIDCRLDDMAHPTHCHHQKAVVIDGQIGFVGGLDITTIEGNRWDVPGHPLRFGRNWHDVALQVRGEAVADLEENFRQRWAAVTGARDLPHRDPVVDPAWHTPCQIIRTVPRRVYPFARRGEFGIAHAYLAAIAGAERFIYLENQYLWSPEIVDALQETMERRADGRFRIVLVLPTRADLGKYDNDKQVEALREADAGRGIFHAYSLYSGAPAAGPFGFGFRPIYVHAKVAIVDDAWYTVGSANLNGRGLATDTEMNAQALDPDGARALRLRLWAEHLGCDVAAIAAHDPLDVIDTLWPRRAAEVQALVARKRGRLPALAHPYETGRMPGAWFLQELEVLSEGL